MVEDNLDYALGIRRLLESAGHVARRMREAAEPQKDS